MISEEYFAMKWFEKEEEKRPSNKLRKANKLWQEGRTLADVCCLTDIWTKVPYPLRFLTKTDWFTVKGEMYNIESFDWYDQMVIRNKDGKFFKKDIYDRRGMFFTLAEVVK